MKPIFIGIAGGTGAGKSTICYALLDKYPNTVGLVELDDYFKSSGEVPKLDGLENWDHPESLHLDRLASDLKALSEGRSITVETKNPRLNPNYEKTQTRIPVEISPKQIMLVEGYLTFWDERVRNHFSSMIYLDVPHTMRYARRVHFKFPEYEERVLIPMHKQFVEATKRYADHIIDVSELTKEQAFDTVVRIISPFIERQI